MVGSAGEDSNQTTITNGTTSSADNSASGAGAVFVYKRTGTTWAQQAYIKASNANAGDAFGSSVAISNDTVAVGAPFEASNQTTITNGTGSSSDNSASGAGAVYIYKRTGTTWAQEAYIKAANAEANDRFGFVALHNDTLVVGAYNEDSNDTIITNGVTASSNNSSSNSGAVYVYKRSGATWAPEAFIKPSNTGADDNFGLIVKIYGDTIVVASPSEDSNQTTITNSGAASSDNSSSGSGAIYVYRRSGVNWAEEAYIKASNADPSDGITGLSIYGDTIAAATINEASNQTTITNGTTSSSNNSAGSAGAVYIYKRTGTSWAQEAYIKAPNAKSVGYLSTVSLYGDTLAAGAYNEQSGITGAINGSFTDDTVGGNQGAVYIFKRTGSNWAYKAFLKTSSTGGQFGFSVATSYDTVVAGANLYPLGFGYGTAFVFFNNENLNWQQQAYLKTPQPNAGDRFGISVGIDNDTIIAGAEEEDSNQTTITNGTSASTDNSTPQAGAAYVFRRTGSTWAQEAYIKAPNPDNTDMFGHSVAISGDTAVVGAYAEDSNQTTITNGATASANNSQNTSGAVYVFKRDSNNSWAQEAYIKAANNDGPDYFGVSVAIDKDTIVVGSTSEGSNQTTITNGNTASGDNTLTNAGAAYVYKRTGATWVQEAYIKPPNPDTGDQFGYDVAIYGDTIIVGANHEASNQNSITNGTTASSDNSVLWAGAAYIFKRSGSLWAQEAYIKPSTVVAFGVFGSGVSISKDTAIISAGNGTYVFQRNGTTWTEEATLSVPSISVGISENTAVIGDYSDDSNQTTITNGTGVSADTSASDAGAVHVFKRYNSTWSRVAYIKAPNAEANDYFGYALAISNDTIVSGAYMEDSNQSTVTNGASASGNNSNTNAGAAYIFNRE